MRKEEEPEVLKELNKQVALNAKEIVEKIQSSLKPGVDQDDLEKWIIEYLKTKVPQITYFNATVTHIDHPKAQ
jgi:F0F1-type ATP synthase membrane subunit b/b'